MPPVRPGALNLIDNVGTVNTACFQAHTLACEFAQQGTASLVDQETSQ
jgi:hypothetical protein